MKTDGNGMSSGKECRDRTEMGSVVGRSVSQPYLRDPG
jgi:hypothetical protein